MSRGRDVNNVKFPAIWDLIHVNARGLPQGRGGWELLTHTLRS